MVTSLFVMITLFKGYKSSHVAQLEYNIVCHYSFFKKIPVMLSCPGNKNTDGTYIQMHIHIFKATDDSACHKFRAISKDGHLFCISIGKKMDVLFYVLGIER